MIEQRGFARSVWGSDAKNEISSRGLDVDQRNSTGAENEPILAAVKKSIHFLFVALIVLAVPLRGYAAATMQLCEATRHGGLATDDPHAAHAHQHDVETSQHGDAQARHGSNSHESHGTSTCSACGACCSGASASTSLPIFPAIRPVSMIAVLLAQEFSGVVLENPERPPLPLVR